MNNEKALTAFINTIVDIRGQLDVLTDLTDEHLGYNPEDINWGHVGTAQHIHELLEEVIAFAAGCKQ